MCPTHHTTPALHPPIHRTHPAPRTPPLCHTSHDPRTDQVPTTKEKVLPIFITIDPRRDGPAQLKSYVADWHPRLLGLTGKQEECDAAAKAYRVYWSKTQLGADASDYLIDQ